MQRIAVILEGYGILRHRVRCLSGHWVAMQTKPTSLTHPEVTRHVPVPCLCCACAVPVLCMRVGPHADRTYLAGKWHVGNSRWSDLPLQRGFDRASYYFGGTLQFFTKKSGGRNGVLFQAFSLSRFFSVSQSLSVSLLSLSLSLSVCLCISLCVCLSLSLFSLSSFAQQWAHTAYARALGSI